MTEHDDALIAELKRVDDEQRNNSQEPDWQAMRRSLRKECDAIEAARNRHWVARLFTWRAARYTAPAAAVALLVVFGATRLNDAYTLDGAALATRKQAILAPSPTPDDSASESILRTAEVIELDEEELDALASGLRSAFAEDTDWVEPSAEATSTELVAPVNSLFPEPNYEQFVDDLNDEQLDAIEHYLKGVHSG